MRSLLGKLAYGALFCALLPAMLALWAHRIDTSGTTFWPQPLPAWAGGAALSAGLVLMAAAIWELWTKGRGLPMNAYPPTRFVTSSVYALLPHPIYLAFGLMVAGTSVIANSSAGLWLVTPVTVLGTFALVLGYEGPKLRECFGAPTTTPWLGMPLAGDARPSMPRRLAAGLTALGPWALAYSLFSMLPAPQGAIELRLGWEAGLVRPEWALWVSSAAYVLAVLGALTADTGDQLRRFVGGAWLMTGMGFFLILMLPGQAELLPSNYSSVGHRPAAINLIFHARWLVFPSFHSAWAVFAAYALAGSLPRLGMLWWVLAFGASAACLLTGSQTIVGVLGGIGLGALGWNHNLVWRALVHVGDRLGNSWTAVRLGKVRVISHAVWSGTAGVAGVLLSLYLSGPQLLVPCGLAMLTGLLSSGAWGYLLEGGGRLSRPFGYYGFVLGVLLVLAVMALVGMSGYGTLAAALATAAPVAQAIGRLRCIVQGCCHGRHTFAGCGFRITHKMSRVTALANLTGVTIYPTQLYSIIGNVALTFILLRLWNTGAAWTLIGGLYLVLASLARFVEEQYRGEPQTMRWSGLSIYQWLSIGCGVLGVLLSMVHGALVRPAQWFSLEGLVLAVLTGLSMAIGMSVDFPGSARRFSRLTVNDT